MECASADNGKAGIGRRELADDEILNVTNMEKRAIEEVSPLLRHSHKLSPRENPVRCFGRAVERPVVFIVHLVEFGSVCPSGRQHRIMVAHVYADAGMNIMHYTLLAPQAGIEPAASGFVDRRSVR